VRVIQRPESRAITALRGRRVDHHLVVGDRGPRVLVPWQEQHGVAPAKALGEGPRGRELEDLDPAADATGLARRGAGMLRSPTR
jgi:hypothetical protein